MFGAMFGVILAQCSKRIAPRNKKPPGPIGRWGLECRLERRLGPVLGLSSIQWIEDDSRTTGNGFAGAIGPVGLNVKLGILPHIIRQENRDRIGH